MIGGLKKDGGGGISIKSTRELEHMREAGKVVASTIAVLSEKIEPGMKTRELDLISAKEIKRLGAKPAFLGYLGFPATICVSVNEEIVHGIPGSRVIMEGDIVSVDVGAIVNGFYGDAAVTIGIGSISEEAQAVIDVTKESLDIGISKAREGIRIGDVGSAIQEFAEKKGYSVVREYVGHGIGRALHEDPQVPNYGVAGKGIMLHEGMTIAIEPMLNVGALETRLLDDGWTVVTADLSLSAHFENTVAITEDGVEVLTKL
jgi:methionyl aminopeptidase